MSRGKTKFAEREEDRLGTLLATRRWCYVIPAEGFVEGHGFRVSIAIEKEPGHRPTGSLAVLSDDQAIVHAAYTDGATAPYFWGMTYAEACEVCKLENEKLGYGPLDVAAIVGSTMGKEGMRKS